MDFVGEMKTQSLECKYNIVISCTQNLQMIYTYGDARPEEDNNNKVF